MYVDRNGIQCQKYCLDDEMFCTAHYRAKGISFPEIEGKIYIGRVNINSLGKNLYLERSNGFIVAHRNHKSPNKKTLGEFMSTG